MSLPLHRRSGLALVLVTLLAGTGQAQKPETQEKEKKKESAKESPEETARKRRKLGHELKMARLSLELAEIQAEIRRATSEGALAKAAFEATQAKSALKHFLEGAAPLAIREARIALDGARFQAEHAKDELAELEAMYKADEFAEMTKELVLKRGRRRLELSERRLAVQEKKLEHLKTTQGHKRRDLEAKAVAATRAAASAKLEHEKAGLETRIALSNARFKITDLQEQIVAVQKKLDKKEAER